MKIERGLYCPFLKKKCIMQDCMLWTQLRGMHPQTEAPIDEYDCAIKWIPLLSIENTGETKKVQGEIEQLRKDTAAQGNALTVMTQVMLEARRSGRKRPVKVIGDNHG